MAEKAKTEAKETTPIAKVNVAVKTMSSPASTPVNETNEHEVDIHAFYEKKLLNLGNKSGRKFELQQNRCLRNYRNAEKEGGKN